MGFAPPPRGGFAFSEQDAFYWRQDRKSTQKCSDPSQTVAARRRRTILAPERKAHNGLGGASQDPDRLPPDRRLRLRGGGAVGGRHVPAPPVRRGGAGDRRPGPAQGARGGARLGRRGGRDPGGRSDRGHRPQRAALDRPRRGAPVAPRDRPDGALPGAPRQRGARARGAAGAAPDRGPHLSLRLLPGLQLLLHRPVRPAPAAAAARQSGLLRALLPVPGVPRLPAAPGVLLAGGHGSCSRPAPWRWSSCRRPFSTSS